VNVFVLASLLAGSQLIDAAAPSLSACLLYPNLAFASRSGMLERLTSPATEDACFALAAFAPPIFVIVAVFVSCLLKAARTDHD
jgi:hypothetical protein